MKMKKLLQAALLTVLVTSLVPTISQAEEVPYEEKSSDTNMTESFTGSAKVVYGQTPSFTVKIPKNIALDDTGTGKYTIGVKGKIPSKYVVSMIPDETITMKEENNLLDSITADVTAEKTTWVADELSEDSYAESTENTIQMQGIDFAKFNGTLNFNISATMPVELKDASDAVKAANKFIGVGTIKSASSLIYVSEITEDISAGDIIYVEGNAFAGGATYKTGYYSIKEVQYAGSGSASEKNLGKGIALGNGALNYVTYLGESYKV